MMVSWSGRRSIPVLRAASLAIASLFLLEAAHAEARKRLDPLKDSGKEFVASLRFADATIESVESGRIRYKVASEKKPRYVKRSDVRVFGEETVSDKPLEFERDLDLDTDESVRIAHSGRYTYIERREKAQSKPQAAVETDAVSAPGSEHIPTPEEVRNVLKLDTVEKREKFASLDEENRRDVLIAAGNIAGIKNVPPQVSIKALKRHVNLFDKQKIREWLIGKADAAGVAGLLDILKPAKAKRDIVKMAYAGLSAEEQKTAKDVARKISDSGVGSLNDEEQQFVKRNRLIFGEN